MCSSKPAQQRAGVPHLGPTGIGTEQAAGRRGKFHPQTFLGGFDTLKQANSGIDASLQYNDYKALRNIMLPRLGLVVLLRTACMFILASSSKTMEHSEIQCKLREAILYQNR